MAQFFCADCNWQGGHGVCPNCGILTESLDTDDYSGMPKGVSELEFASELGNNPQDNDFNDGEDEL